MATRRIFPVIQAGILPAAGAPVLEKVTGTNKTFWRSRFADGSDLSFDFQIPVPAGYTAGGTRQVNLYWTSSANAGDCMWRAWALCFLDGSVWDAALDGPVAGTDTPAAVAGQLQKTTVDLSSLAEWDPDGTVTLRIGRLGSNAGDTLGAEADLLIVELEVSDAGVSASEITAAPGALEHDYEPAGWGATTVRLNPSVDSVITGFGELGSGTEVTLINVSDRLIVLAIENSGSTDVCRMQTEILQGSHFLMAPGDTMLLERSAADNRWSVIPIRETMNDREHGRVGEWLPTESNTPSFYSLTRGVIAGTRTTPNLSTGSYIDSIYRLKNATQAITGQVAGIRFNTAVGSTLSAVPGDGGGQGGFLFNAAWGVEDRPDTASSAFIGVSADDAVAANAALETLLNCVGFGFSPTDTTWRFQHNDGAGSATMVDLGANFPVNTTSWFTGYIYWSPNDANRISYAIWREDDKSLTPVVGEVSTDLPAVVMGPWAAITNCAVNTIHSLSWSRVRIRNAFQ